MTLLPPTDGQPSSSSFFKTGKHLLALQWKQGEISPPPDSSSWVAAAQVRVEEEGEGSVPGTPSWPHHCPPGSPGHRSARRWRLGWPSPSGPGAPPRRACAARHVWPCSPGTRPWCGTGGSAAWRASPAAVSRTHWEPPLSWCWSCGSSGAARCTSPWTPSRSECTILRTCLERHHKGPFLTCSTNPGNNLQGEKKERGCISRTSRNPTGCVIWQHNWIPREKGRALTELFLQHYPHSGLTLSHEDRRRMLEDTGEPWSGPLQLFWQPHLEAKLGLFSECTRCHSVTRKFSSLTSWHCLHKP